MRTLGLLPMGVASLLAVMPHVANAQTTSPTFFISQKVWFASWDYPAIDARLIAPTPQSPAPLVQQSTSKIELDHAIPLTTFGARIDKWSLSTSIAPSTRFSDSKLHEGSVRRSEYDVSVGYEVATGVNLALIYKGGRVAARSLVDSVAPATLSSDQKLEGLILGVAASRSVAENLAVYGTLAYGPGRADLGQFGVKVDIKYTVAELGASYRVPAFPSLSVQAGYRYQAVKYEDLPLTTFALTPAPVEISRANHSPTSRTAGFVLGVSLGF